MDRTKVLYYNLSMKEFSQHQDIETVMKKARDSLVVIEDKYKKCLDGQNIPESLLVKIKEYLGNIRSALDYSWNKIPGVKGGNFPIVNSKKKFSNLAIGIAPIYVDVLEKWQPYNNQDWIQWMTTLNNKNKHVTLVPQICIKTNQFFVKKKGSKKTIATFRGCTFGGNGKHISIGGVPMPINLKTQMPENVPGLDIERIIWIDFCFDTSMFSSLPKNISALPFLKLCFKNIQNVIDDIEKV